MSTFQSSPIGGKRPADESNQFDVVAKRPANDKDTKNTPLMSQQHAEKIIKLLGLPKRSQYVRFKSVMLKEAKKQGDNETIRDITSAAKNAWKMVKNHKCEVKPLESSCKDANIDTGMIKSDTKLDRLVRLKRLALLEEKAEMYDFDEQMKKFKSNYLEAAITVAHWKTVDMNKTNYKSVETEVDNIYAKVMTAWGGGSAFPPKMGEIYKHFKVKLSAITKEVSSEELASKLQDAPQKVLLQHAQDHYDLQVQVKDLQVQSNELKVQSNELKVIKAKAKAPEDRQMRRLQL